MVAGSKLITLILYSLLDFNVRDLRDHLVQASYLEVFLALSGLFEAVYNARFFLKFFSSLVEK